MRSGAVVFFGVALAVAAACGSSKRPNGQAAGAGASGGTGGSGGAGNAAEAGVQSGAGEAGMPSDGTGATGGGGGSPAAGTGGAAVAGAGKAPATGGSSSGSPSSAGAAAAGAPSIAVPEGCELVSPHSGGLFCSAEMTCGGERMTVSCDATDEGPWWCSCNRGETRTDFELPDTTGTRTCEVAATACLHPELFTGDETCTVTDEVIGEPESGQTCSIVDSCKLEQELDGTMVSSKVDFTAKCEVVNTELSSCVCPSSRSPAYWLATDDFSAGCDFLSPLCRGNLTSTGDWTCESLFEDWGAGYGCHSAAKCTRPATLDGGFDLTLAEQYNLNCWEFEGVTRCTCEAASGYSELTLLHGIPYDDIAACQLTSDACAEVEAVDFRGSPECTALTDTHNDATCALKLTCGQAATIAGTEVTVLTRRGATCDHRSDGSWNCTCAGAAPEVTTVSVEAEDSESACARATEACPARSLGYE